MQGDRRRAVAWGYLSTARMTAFIALGLLAVDICMRLALGPTSQSVVGPIRLVLVEHRADTMDLTGDAAVSSLIALFCACFVAMTCIWAPDLRGSRHGVIPGIAVLLAGIAVHWTLEVASGSVPDFLALGYGRVSVFDSGDVAVVTGVVVTFIGFAAVAAEILSKRLAKAREQE